MRVGVFTCKLKPHVAVERKPPTNVPPKYEIFCCLLHMVFFDLSRSLSGIERLQKIICLVCIFLFIIIYYLSSTLTRNKPVPHVTQEAPMWVYKTSNDEIPRHNYTKATLWCTPHEPRAPHTATAFLYTTAFIIIIAIFLLHAQAILL